MHHRIRSIQNAQQAIRHSSVIFVAPYWNYRISCLKVQLAHLAQDADSEKWNISLDYVKKGLSPDLEYFRLPTSKRSRLIIGVYNLYHDEEYGMKLISHSSLEGCLSIGRSRLIAPKLCR